LDINTEVRARAWSKQWPMPIWRYQKKTRNWSTCWLSEGAPSKATTGDFAKVLLECVTMNPATHGGLHGNRISEMFHFSTDKVMENGSSTANIQ